MQGIGGGARGRAREQAQLVADAHKREPAQALARVVRHGHQRRHGARRPLCATQRKCTPAHETGPNVRSERRRAARCAPAAHQTKALFGLAMHAFEQANGTLDPIGNSEAIHMHLRVQRTHAHDAADPLPQQGIGPRHVEVHEHTRVLKIHAFGQHIGGDQQSERLMGRRWRYTLRDWREPPEHFASRNGPACNLSAFGRHRADASDVCERTIEGAHGAGELRECEYGLTGMRVEHFTQCSHARTVAGCHALVMCEQFRNRAYMAR